MDATILTPNECRVLGTLVEKAQTTPGQYPLTLNALVNGCNQRNNRDPITDLDEDAVLIALDRLRAKGLVREAVLSGSRVAKYRHVAREALDITTDELVLLTELLLRGPQSVGELRGRASRMHPIESLDACQGMLDGMARAKVMEDGDTRPVLVKELPPSPGSRASRWVQLLCPTLHPLHASGEVERPRADDHENGSGIESRVTELARELASLRARIEALELRSAAS